MRKLRKPAGAVIVWLVLLMGLGQIVWAGATLDYGQLTGVPPDGTVTYIAYLTETNGDEILTEDGYNAGSGTDLGYASAYWWLAVSNFDTENDGDQVEIYFTGTGPQEGNAGSHTFNWDGINGFTDHSEIPFGPSSNPPAPTNLVSSPGSSAGTIDLTWTDHTGGTAAYRLYRSTQGSGANNDASNGHYYRVTPFTYECASGTCTGSDTTAVLDMTNWYIVVAEGSLSGHSNEGFAEPPPTAVALVSFQARPEGNRIALEWETASEVDALGFNLYRAETPEGAWLQLNPDLIPCQAPGGLGGALYHYPDDSVTTGVTYYYWLESVDVSGGTVDHGPVSAALFGYRIHLPLIMAH